MKRATNKASFDTVLAKINFLENQLLNLDHFLPETYDYLMFELDIQKYLLAELEVERHFKQLDQKQLSDEATQKS